MPVTRRQSGEDGAIAVFYAIMVLVLAGFGAIMVDVGELYAEGRQLQNGAENAALEVAKTCVKNSGGCNASVASALANANANDAAATVHLVCGTGPGLSSCPSAPQRPRFDCLPHSGSALYAEVRTSTRRSDGSQVLPGWLIRLVDPSYAGTSVHACARAAYGAPSGLTSELPLVISLCDFNNLKNTAGLSDPPPYPPFPPSTGWFHPTSNPGSEHVRIWSKTNTALAGSCTGPAGQQLPGGFGWVDTQEDLNSSASGCAATTDTSNNVGSDPGASAPKGCDLAPLLGKTIAVPVYDEQQGTGNTATFHIKGYAAFYLTGYSFTGGDAGYAAPLTSRPCQTNEGMCISGYLYDGELAPAAGATIGGPSMGITIIRMTG